MPNEEWIEQAAQELKAFFGLNPSDVVGAAKIIREFYPFTDVTPIPPPVPSDGLYWLRLGRTEHELAAPRWKVDETWQLMRVETDQASGMTSCIPPGGISRRGFQWNAPETAGLCVAEVGPKVEPPK